MSLNIEEVEISINRKASTKLNYQLSQQTQFKQNEINEGKDKNDNRNILSID